MKIYNPLEFVAESPAGRHLVLFYDDESYARTIEFWYILNGLWKEECCVYTTHGDPLSVEREMANRGIDVDSFKKRGLLHVLKIKDPLDDPRGVSNGVREAAEVLFEGKTRKPPFRIVSRFVRRALTPREVRVNMDIDSNVHAAIKSRPRPSAYSLFANLKGSLICPYPLNALTKDHRNWVASHLKSHDAALFAPREGSGFVLTS